MTSKQWRIENTHSGVDLGTYPGATQAEALDAFARDAGYADYADLNAQVPAKPGEIAVTQADAPE